ncbi:DUF257 family protein [Thermococcus peptonophilus]|uniref:DUF257 family protein n=1 Tax=Thermococcus peptonophilus TaxID=53952 RepID=UPI0006D273DD
MISKVPTRYKTSLLIEHTSEDIVGYTLIKLLQGLTKIQDNPRNIIITDFLDTLSIYLYQAELLNMDTTFVRDLSVIKVGGTVETGKVLYKIPISPPYPVYKARYNEAISKILENRESQPPQFNIQLGIEMVINLFNRHEMLEQIHDIGRQIIQNRGGLSI